MLADMDDTRGEQMQTISWQEFEMVELRVGTLVRVEPFPEARAIMEALGKEIEDFDVE